MHRRRIGVVVNELENEDSYQISIWKASLALCRLRNFDLTFLVARWLDVDDPEVRASNALLKLALPPTIDGVLYSTACLSQVKDSRLLLSDLPDLPSVTMSLGLPGLPQVSIDNTTGMEELIRHVIRVHGRRQIACVRGPVHNSEAKVRFECWQRVLAQEGLVPTDQLWVQGAFDPGEVVDWLDRLHIQTGGNYDAIVCPNDFSALGVMTELQRRGVRVPEQVVVVGFDDIPRAKYHEPSLTTSFQPIEYQTGVAIWLLMDLIEGKPVPREVVLPSQPLFRGSCGCWAPEPRDYLPEPGRVVMVGGVPWSLPSEPEFASSLRRRSADEQGLAELRDPGEIARWLKSVVAARQESFSLQSQLSVTMNVMFRELGKLLTLSEIGTVLGDYLPQLGIRRCLLAQTLGDDGKPGNVLVEAGSGHVIGQPPRRYQTLFSSPAIPEFWGEAGRFDGTSLGPSGWIDQVSGINFAVYPLVVGSEWQGLLCMELLPDHGLIYLNLARQISMILDREQRLQHSLRKTMDERLKTLVEQEKMQALTILVAGVAHEVNTPLGNGITAGSLIQDQFREHRKLYEKGTLTQSQWEKFFDNGDETVEILQRNLLRAADLVGSFKQVAAQRPDDVHTFRLMPLLGNILTILSPQLRRQSLVPVLVGPPELSITTSSGPFVDIITNLVLNAQIHAFGEGLERAPTLRIEVIQPATAPGRIRIEVIDNGRGIEPKVLPHIFEPFFTTRRGLGGTGLGLHIVYNLVVHRLQGSIECRSQFGGGCTFVLEFPAELVVGQGTT